ncbi:MAG: hypothetical protein QOG04_1367 [Actinomycetota bacterium]|jgi:hypothetical protein|nr:hypothetical protein [Actinomycetota bacterium]
MSENRSKKAVIGELLAWFGVALATAVILVALSEKLLPSSF